MSRKKTKRPLTAKQAAKQLGVTAAVKPAPEPTLPVKDAEQAVEAALSMGQQVGRIEGGLRYKQALNQCPIYRLLMEVHAEVHSAQRKHRAMAGPHEAYAVILEELDEYWDEVKADRAKQASGRKELIQVAAMAVRALHDTAPSR